MENTKVVETLLKQAADTPDSGDAMRFTQAALNATNAVRQMAETKRERNAFD